MVKKMESELSLYIPAYNAEKTITKCLNSILAQTYKPKKIIVINDCSEDDTEKILKSFDNQIDVINNIKNLGVSHSMNLAINHLTTRYIGKIDADVELDKHWAELLLKKMQEEKITLIGGKMYEKYINNPYNYWRSIRLKQNWGEYSILNPKFVFGCNNILDTKNLDKKNLYRDDLSYFRTNGEDIEISNYLKKRGHKLFYFSDAICNHLQNDDAISLSNRYWRYIHYGDGLKKRNLIKTIKNCFRQFKKFIKFSFIDFINFRLSLVKVNFFILYYFIIIDFRFYKSNEK